MSTLTILRKLGVYVDEQFWSAEFCRKLCEEIRAAPGKPAKVINAAGEKRVDEEVRNTLAKKVSAETSRAVTESASTPGELMLYGLTLVPVGADSAGACCTPRASVTAAIAPKSSILGAK